MLTKRDLRLPPTVPARIALILMAFTFVIVMYDKAMEWFHSGNLSLVILAVLVLYLPSLAVILVRLKGWGEARRDFAQRFTRPGSPSPTTKTESEPGDDD